MHEANQLSVRFPITWSTSSWKAPLVSSATHFIIQMGETEAAGHTRVINMSAGPGFMYKTRSTDLRVSVFCSALIL